MPIWVAGSVFCALQYMALHQYQPCLVHNSIVVNTSDPDKPESFERHTCQHVMCQSCLLSHIQQELQRNLLSSSQAPAIKCPYSDCMALVSYYDIARVSRPLAELYSEILAVKLSNRPDLDIPIDVKPLRCPKCKVYIYRNGGCEVIYCICGFVFCSDCLYMYKGCRCFEIAALDK